MRQRYNLPVAELKATRIFNEIEEFAEELK